jgi:hypothetical protein
LPEHFPYRGGTQRGRDFERPSAPAPCGGRGCPPISLIGSRRGWPPSKSGGAETPPEAFPSLSDHSCGRGAFRWGGTCSLLSEASRASSGLYSANCVVRVFSDAPCPSRTLFVHAQAAYNTRRLGLALRRSWSVRTGAAHLRSDPRGRVR